MTKVSKAQQAILRQFNDKPVILANETVANALVRKGFCAFTDTTMPGDQNQMKTIHLLTKGRSWLVKYGDEPSTDESDETPTE